MLLSSIVDLGMNICASLYI